MALVAAVVKKKVEAALVSALAREFKEEIAQNSSAAASHKKLAAAIADAAEVIVTEILTTCQVMPGQSVVGAGGGVPGPMSGSTVSPGTLM